MKPKIRVFIVSNCDGYYVCPVAIAEDGKVLAEHMSSSVLLAKADMGFGSSTRKHDLYDTKYPDGYELVWVDDWHSDPFLCKLVDTNRKEAVL